MILEHSPRHKVCVYGRAISQVPFSDLAGLIPGLGPTLIRNIVPHGCCLACSWNLIQSRPHPYHL